MGHGHAKDEHDNRDEFYPGIEALEQAFSFCIFFIHQAFFKKPEDIGQCLLDKTLLFGNADRAAGAGRDIAFFHPVGYHTILKNTGNRIITFVILCDIQWLKCIGIYDCV